MFTADNIPQRIEKDELINLVPHKGKMFLLSRVISHDTVIWILKIIRMEIM